MAELNQSINELIKQIDTLVKTVDENTKEINVVNESFKARMLNKKKQDTQITLIKHENQLYRERLVEVENSQQVIGKLYDDHKIQQDNILNSHTKITTENKRLEVEIN